MSTVSASTRDRTLSRRRFLRLVTAAGGTACFGTRHQAFSQDLADRAAINDSLRGRLYFWVSKRWDPDNAGVFAYDLVTRKWQSVVDGAEPEWFCRASPDGKSFAVSHGVPPGPLRVLMIGTNGRRKVSDLRSRVYWAPNGRQVVQCEWEPGRRRWASKTWRMNPDGTGRVDLPVPANELLIDWSADGRWFLLGRQGELTNRSYLIRRADGTDPRPLLDDVDLRFVLGRFSPDGRRVAYTRDDQQMRKSSLWVIDVETRADRRILDGDADGYPEDTPCWSPDGKFLAVVMSDRNRDPASDRRIEIVDLNGRRIRELGLPHKLPVPCDWR